jgi:hypothetical protein
MALITLSGVIDKDDLNNNFNDRSTQIEAALKADKKTFEYELEVFDLSSASGPANTTLDFTPPDDVEVLDLCLYVNSATASITLTAELTAIDFNEVSVPQYLNDQSVTVTVASIVGETNATRFNRKPTTSNKIFLKKGLTYRLRVTSSSASIVDYCQIVLVCRNRRRANAS